MSLAFRVFRYVTTPDFGSSMISAPAKGNLAGAFSYSHFLADRDGINIELITKSPKFDERRNIGAYIIPDGFFKFEVL